MADTQRMGRHYRTPPRRFRSRAKLKVTIVAICIIIAIVVSFAVYSLGNLSKTPPVARSGKSNGSQTAPHYIGLYAPGVPDSYVGVKAFTKATGVEPGVVVYYSGWLEPFQTSFATTAANNGAVPLVQIDPKKINIAEIASGRYDNYLISYAKAVRAYRHQVILSFGHEMNGYWYSWGYAHTSPSAFVDAWRHIVTLFRTLHVRNVTWLWTINTIHKHAKVPPPGPWWPGNSYVDWVGIDGYFTNSSSVFASVFGPTIVYVRTLTHAPILIAETSATPIGSQPAKIADLFSGIHLYGLLGFVWFNSVYKVDWRLSSPAAIAAFRKAAKLYHRNAPEIGT